MKLSDLNVHLLYQRWLSFFNPAWWVIQTTYGFSIPSWTDFSIRRFHQQICGVCIDMWYVLNCIDIFDMYRWSFEGASEAPKVFRLLRSQSSFWCSQTEWNPVYHLDYIRWSFGACWNWKVDVCKCSSCLCHFFSNSIQSKSVKYSRTMPSQDLRHAKWEGTSLRRWKMLKDGRC